MDVFRRVCVELSLVLVLLSLTGLTSGWALALAGLVLVLAALTMVIEAEARAVQVDDLPESIPLPEPEPDHEPESIPLPEPDPGPDPEPTPLPEPEPAPEPGSLVAYRPPGALAVLVPPVVTVTFRLPDVGQADTVHVVGEFNDWSRQEHPMARVGDTWMASLVVRRGSTYRYRFLLDGTTWENDWSADDYVPNEFGGEDSVVDLR
jgi:hypothetical protein